MCACRVVSCRVVSCRVVRLSVYAWRCVRVHLLMCVCAHAMFACGGYFIRSSAFNRPYMHSRREAPRLVHGQDVQHTPACLVNPTANPCHGSICCQGQQGIKRALIHLVWSCMFVRFSCPVLLAQPVCPLPISLMYVIHMAPHTLESTHCATYSGVGHGLVWFAKLPCFI